MAAAALAASVRFSVARFVLLLWSRIAHPIAVQRIEGGYVEGATDTHRDGNVVAELRRPRRDRQHAAVIAREVAGEEVQPNQLDPGVAYGCDERIGLGIGWYRLMWPRPPELNGIEACGPSRRRSLQQFDLGEEQ